MKYIFSFLFFLPCFCVAQSDNGLLELYRNYTPYQTRQTIAPVKNIMVTEYSERYHRKYDSIATTYFPSGNIASKTFYSGYSTAINFVYEYLDNNKEQINKIFSYGSYNKPMLKYSYTYNTQGMETATIYDNYGAEERKYLYKYDNRGNQIEFIGTYRGNPDHDFEYEYDEQNRKIKEVHKGRGDVILFQYDLKGNKVEEIHMGSSQVEKVLLFGYDRSGNETSVQAVLGGGNLRRSNYFFNVSKQKILTMQYDAEGFVDTKIMHQYDRNGNLSEEVTWRPGMQSYFVFDKNGDEILSQRRTRGNYPGGYRIEENKLKSVKRDSIGRVIKKEWANNYTTYSYDANCPSKIRESLTYGFENFIYNKTSYEYDANCRVISKTNISFHPHLDYGPQKLPDTIKTFYIYNKNGDIIEEREVRPSGDEAYHLKILYKNKKVSEVILEDKARHKRSLYNFNSKEELIKLQTFIDKMISEDISYSFEYDAKGNWVKRTAVDKQNEKKFSVIERVVNEW